MIDSTLLNFLEEKLTLVSNRQQVLSSNIANVDTPGYRAQDVRFDQQLRILDLERTSSGHIALQPGRGQTRTFDLGGDAKPNGNDVNLDRELTEVTKNGLEFITLMQFLQNKLRTIRTSLNEGGAS